MTLKRFMTMCAVGTLFTTACSSAGSSGVEPGTPAQAEKGSAQTAGGETAASAQTADSITTNGGNTIQLDSLPHYRADSDAVVYFIPEISPESLVRAYQAMNWTPEGRVGVKLSTGESEKSNYLRPDLIKNLVQSVSGTIVECNTAYGGSRATTEKHNQAIDQRGFRDIAEVDILDTEGSISLPVDGRNLKEDLVGARFKNYGSYLVLSHFKGHAMAGFGGAIKNISIGFGSSEGKLWIHSAGRTRTEWLADKQDEFLESMAEAGLAVSNAMNDGKNIAYVSVLNRLSVDCDCDGNPAEPDMHDIGVLASTDPLAIDQAAIDLVYAAPDSASLKQRIERQNGLHTLDYAESIHLGSRYYKLVTIK